MSSPKSHSPIDEDKSEPTFARALRDHPHVQTVLVRLEKRKLDNSINGEAYAISHSQDTDSGWSRSSVAVEGTCNDGAVTF